MSKSQVSARPASVLKVQDITSLDLEKIELHVKLCSKDSLKALVEAHQQKWNPTQANHWYSNQWGAEQGTSSAQWGLSNAVVIRVRIRQSDALWQPEHLQEPLKALLKLKAKPRVVHRHREWWTLVCSLAKGDDVQRQHALTCMLLDMLDPKATKITFNGKGFTPPEEKVHTVTKADVQKIVEKVRSITKGEKVDDVLAQMRHSFDSDQQPWSVYGPKLTEAGRKFTLEVNERQKVKYSVTELLPAFKAMGLNAKKQAGWIVVTGNSHSYGRSELMIRLLAQQIPAGVDRVVYEDKAIASSSNGQSLTKFQRLALQKLEAVKSGLNRQQFSQLKRELALAT